MEDISLSDAITSRYNAVRSSRTPSPTPGGSQPPRPRTNNDAPPMTETHRVADSSSRWRSTSPGSTTRYIRDLDARGPPSPVGSGLAPHSPRDSTGLSQTRPSTPDYGAPFFEEGSSLRPWSNDRRTSRATMRQSVELPIMMARQSMGLVYNEVPGTKLVPLMIGFVITAFLAGFDASSCALTYPSIQNTFPNTDIFWLKTVYILTFHAACPLYARYSDIFGRRPLLCASLAIYAIGSVTAGLAVNMAMLAACRAFAGLGAAGFLSMVLVVLGDLFPLKKRPVYQLLVFISFILGEIAGPIITSVITTYLNWRSFFWLSAILAVIALTLILSFLKLSLDQGFDDRPLTFSDRLALVDYFGTILLVGAIVAFLLATIWAASGIFHWSSGAVIGLYHAAAICLAIFLVIENSVAVLPLVPLQIVEERSLLAILVISMTIGFGWNGFFEHVPLFMQVLHQESSLMSSLRFIPLFVANIICSILAVTTVSRLGFRFYLAFGLALFTAGIGLTSTLDLSTGVGQEIAFFLEFGAGTGLFLPILVTAGQAFAREDEMAIVTNFIVFLMSLSGTIGDAVWEGILTTDFSARLDQISTDILPATSKQLALTSITSIATLPATTQSAIVAAFIESVQLALHITIPFAAVAFFAAFWVEGYHMTRRAHMYLDRRVVV